MQVPNDYMIEMFRQSVNERIDILEENIKDDMTQLRNNITQLKEDMKEFRFQCRDDMKIHSEEIEDLKSFKYKMYAYSGAVAFVSAMGFKLIFN